MIARFSGSFLMLNSNEKIIKALLLCNFLPNHQVADEPCCLLSQMLQSNSNVQLD